MSTYLTKQDRRKNIFKYMSFAPLIVSAVGTVISFALFSSFVLLGPEPGSLTDVIPAVVLTAVVSFAIAGLFFWALGFTELHDIRKGRY